MSNRAVPVKLTSKPSPPRSRMIGRAEPVRLVSRAGTRFGGRFGGRMPIHVWPRPLMWAFEWHDPARDIVLQRGEPLFYVQFEASGPDRPIQLIEAERTSALSAYLDSLSGVVNYVSQTFSLLQAAEALRPPALLTPKARPRPPAAE